jgi:DNA-binding CsgD family transcriptional regulator
MLRTSRELLEAADGSARSEPIARLSEQEHRVLRSLSEGQSPANVVHALKISPQTLRNHLHHINQKLGTHNRLEAVIHAIRRRLI